MGSSARHVINKLEHQNSLVLKEKDYLKRVDKFLIAKFDAIEAQMNKDCVVATARLQTTLEDMEFQMYVMFSVS